jgi:hypothetical protein
MGAMVSLSYQRMELRFGDPILFTAFVWAKVPFCLDLLLSPAPPLPHLPRDRLLTLGFCPLVLALATKPAIAFALRTQNSRFAGSLHFFLLLQETAKPISPRKTTNLKQ